MIGNSAIAKALDYIEANLDGKLSLDEISWEVGYSKFHLSRLFSESVGYTLYKYIQMRRLTVAAEKLVITKKTIAQIACEANYESQQAFTLAFKKLHLCTPQIYRRNGIHTPKLNRFTPKSNLKMMAKYAMNCEAMAA